MKNQPPSGGCVLKQRREPLGVRERAQPPSGGCVLKPDGAYRPTGGKTPAAFRRLCVETLLKRC